MADVVVHHLENSRSIRALWMLEELGVDYTIREYKRNPKTMRAPPELRAIHPLGRSPVVVVDGLVLAESGAILEYLVERFGEGRFKPTDPVLVQRWRFFMHYAEGSVMSPLIVKLILSRIRSAPVPFFIKPITKKIAAQVDKTYASPEAENHFRFIEASLGEHLWFAGPEFSSADIQMSYPIDAVQHRGVDLGPKSRAFLAAIAARPAHQRAIARGGENAGFG